MYSLYEYTDLNLAKIYRAKLHVAKYDPSLLFSETCIIKMMLEIVSGLIHIYTTGYTHQAISMKNVYLIVDSKTK